MSFKSSRGKNVGKELEVWQSSIIGQGLGGGGASVPVSVTTGGDVDGLEPGNGYVYHTFTNPGTFVLSGDPISADILVVAGGGGGGTGNYFQPSLSGGGGGGVAWISSIDMDPGTYPVTVGAGGEGAPSPGSGSNGQDSLFGPGTSLPITAKGGGYGRGETPAGNNGGPGGSGGGADISGGGVGGSTIQHSENGPLIPLGLMNFGSPGFSRSGGGVSGAGPGAAGVYSQAGSGLINYDFEGDKIGVSPFGAKFGAGGSVAPGGFGGSAGGYGGGGGGGSGWSFPGSQGIVIVRYLKGYSN